MLQNKRQVETVNFRLYFILSDDDFEIKSKIYSSNLRLVLKHILHSRDVFFRNQCSSDQHISVSAVVQ